MSQRDDSGFRQFTADGAIPLYSRVKITTTGIDVAGLAEKSIGTLQTAAAIAAGDVVSVKLRSAAGTHKVLVSEAMAQGAVAYSEASGKVQDTAQATAFIEGVILEAASADGDVVEFLYNNAGDTAAV